MTDKHIQYIRKHAIDNVWCAPGQDNSFMLQLPRISAPTGIYGSVNLSGSLQDLPTQGDRWQVFQIGGIPPSALGMLKRELHWVSFEEHANQNKGAIRLVSDDGIVVGAGDVFYRYTYAGNLIVAARMDERSFIDWQSDDFYLTLYQGTWWATVEGNASSTGFEVYALRVEKSSDLDDIDATYQLMSALAEGAHQFRYWRNGFLCTYQAAVIEAGDSIWMELDGSIEEVASFNLRGLTTFNSTLDNTRKYLLHLPKKENDYINYIDELEVFLQSDTLDKKSVKVLTLRPSSLRQLTHRDYSLNVSDVLYQAQKLSAVTNQVLDRFKLVVYVRAGARHKELVHEASFIQELYKLTDEQIVQAMVGVNATVPFWQAAALEASSYTKLMRANHIKEITYLEIEKAYGYYALAKALGDNPVRVLTPGITGYVPVPYVYAWGATAYEYDETGLLLGWSQHLTGLVYHVRDPKARLVEFICGLGGSVLDEVSGQTEVAYSDSYNWRVYQRNRVGGVVQPGFTDITNTDRCKVVNGRVVITQTAATQYFTVRTDKRFYARDYLLNISDGQLQFSLQMQEVSPGQPRQEAIGLGQWDVMLNGFSLIRGLHYFIEGTTFTITARDYIDNTPGAKQRVHVRGMGFAQKSGQPYPEGDWGFIKHGILSQNARFNVRDGRVARVVVGGRLYHQDMLEFAEDSNAVAPIDASNGMPYLIKDIYVPLRPFTLADTWSLIDQARSRAAVVEDYMTLKKPEPDRGLCTVAQRHRIVSPFLCAILYDLLYARLNVPQGTLTRQLVINACKSYEYLLKSDVLQTGYDKQFVDVVPHTKRDPVVVSINQWDFLQKVVFYYAKDQVDLSSTLRVSS